MIVIRIMHHIRKNIKLPINSTNRKKKNKFLLDRMQIPPTRPCRGRFLFRTTIICENFQTIWWPMLQKKELAILDKRVVLKIFRHVETIMTSLKRTCLWGISPGMLMTSSNTVLMKVKNSCKNFITIINSVNLSRPLLLWKVTEAIRKFKFKKQGIARKIKLKNKITNW